MAIARTYNAEASLVPFTLVLEKIGNIQCLGILIHYMKMAAMQNFPCFSTDGNK